MEIVVYFTFFKLSDGQLFWLNLRNNDKSLCEKAITSQCLAKKLKKRDLDLKFFHPVVTLVLIQNLHAEKILARKDQV